MSIIQSIGGGLGGAGAPGGPLGSFFSTTIDNSLRLTSAGSSRLTFSQGSPTDISKWTVNFWLKRNSPLEDTSDYDTIFGVNGPGNTAFTFLGGHIHFFVNINDSGGQASLITNREFRDPGAWYNFHITFDRANSTAAERLRIYVNGVEETSFSTDQRSTIASDSSTGWNVSGANAAINSRSGDNADRFHDGYLAQFHNIDGAVVAPTSFAETKDGVWIPKAYSGSYGNNGWLLEFKQTGTGTGAANTVGADTSGKDNHWDSSGIAAHDVVPDSPTNNWSTLNPLKVNDRTQTFAEGDLDFSSTNTGTNPAVTSTFAVTSGKWYWEVYIRAEGNVVNSVGIASNPNDLENDTSALYSKTTAYSYQANGNKHNNSDASYGDTWTTGDIIGVALDLDAGALYFYKNGTIQNSGTAAYTSLSGEFTSYSLVYNSGAQVYNFGQDDTFNNNKTSGSANASDGNGLGEFYYSVPSGYKSLCASNLPDVTIGPGQDEQADDYFNTVLYTGDGSTSNAITGVGFQPDWVWLKKRSAAGIHNMFDSVRGTKLLQPNETDAQQDNANYLTAYGADGFTVGNSANVNESSATFVSWNWEAGGSANTFNIDGTGYASMSAAPISDGTQALTGLSANTTSKFSIATFTMPDAQKTVAHGLGVKPDWVIFKHIGADSTHWQIWHNSFGENTEDVIRFNVANGTDQAGGSANWFQAISTTLTTIQSAGSYFATGDYVMYSFANVDGYSKFDTFIGNGAADGAFVYTGFRPAWLLIKRTTSGGWHMFDNKRASAFNEIGVRIETQESEAENSNSSPNIDLVSNGFKLRTTFDNMNASGGTYLYFAFAEAPFKFSNAR